MDKTSEEQQQRSSVFERHAQTLMAVVVTALVLWVGKTVSEQSTSMALLNQSVSRLEKEVSTFTSTPRFSKDDFTSEMRIYDRRLDLVERAQSKNIEFLTSLEKRVRMIEALKDIEQ